MTDGKMDNKMGRTPELNFPVKHLSVFPAFVPRRDPVSFGGALPFSPFSPFSVPAREVKI